MEFTPMQEAVIMLLHDYRKRKIRSGKRTGHAERLLSEIEGRNVFLVPSEQLRAENYIDGGCAGESPNEEPCDCGDNVTFDGPKVAFDDGAADREKGYEKLPETPVSAENPQETPGMGLESSENDSMEKVKADAMDLVDEAMCYGYTRQLDIESRTLGLLDRCFAIAASLYATASKATEEDLLAIIGEQARTIAEADGRLAEMTESRDAWRACYQAACARGEAVGNG